MPLPCLEAAQVGSCFSRRVGGYRRHVAKADRQRRVARARKGAPKGQQVAEVRGSIRGNAGCFLWEGSDK
jgi:hypothetical protein